MPVLNGRCVMHGAPGTEDGTRAALSALLDLSKHTLQYRLQRRPARLSVPGIPSEEAILALKVLATGAMS